MILIFSVKLWHLFEGDFLFTPIHPETNEESTPGLLSNMLAVMGRPSDEMFQRDGYPNMLNKLWFSKGGEEESGSGHDIAPIPKGVSWESKEKRLEGKEKEEFLRFMKRMIQWDPERRATAAEMLEDPYLQH